MYGMEYKISDTHRNSFTFTLIGLDTTHKRWTIGILWIEIQMQNLPFLMDVCGCNLSEKYNATSTHKTCCCSL